MRSLRCRRPCGTLGRSCGDDQKRQRRRRQRCFIILFGRADSAGRDAAAAIGRLPAPCRLRSHPSTKQERIRQSDEPAWQRSHARSAGLDSFFGIAQAMEEVAKQPVCSRGCSRCWGRWLSCLLLLSLGRSERLPNGGGGGLEDAVIEDGWARSRSASDRSLVRLIANLLDKAGFVHASAERGLCAC